jgi:5-(carboxyamino)imidazole ribonucleotide synthase
MRLGVLGGGQLGRMLALAGYPLGLTFRFFDTVSDACAGQVGDLVTGSFDDPQAVSDFAEGLDVITYEWENVPVDAVRLLAERVPVFPPPEALEVAQDRLAEKHFFQQLGIPTPAFEAIDSLDALQGAVQRLGLPAVLKTRREGYDGKGQRIIRAAGEIEPGWEDLGNRGPLILEQFVSFEREVSIIAARGRDGDCAFYPLVQNTHTSGILSRSVAPAPDVRNGLQRTAEDYGRSVVERLAYAGVLAIEFFVSEGRLLANELAPRVHNSGHWTIEGAETSQFENHVRAVAGLPLGSTAMRGQAAVLNLIGATPDGSDVLAIPNAHLHLYGKSPRPGRKLGHVTVRSDGAGEVEAAVEQVQALIRAQGGSSL